ncbi:ASKHA domain-containing protein [Candidatus Acetothermia bacterium]|nr:ASKHA domain-containing protein [Candidatus Acetothermia bacterium]MCI2431626.1 ASKHA domain-containing protein [Candidatus Acetothermia bacterium]MCI2437174.1 ASKHA domain-containing protein [Candidatus Acetothermia bacterium]
MPKVTFHPDEVTVEVERSVTLQAAAKAAGVELASICGGDGICGRCRLIIKNGNIDAAPTTLLNRHEVQRGYVLACQTKVLGDVEVEVPPETRAEEGQILIDIDAQRFRALYQEEKVSFRHEPLVQKLYLELTPPSLQDNLGDEQRLYREIRRRREIPIMQTGLKVLQALPKLARQHQWRVTATLGWRGGTVEILQIEGGDLSENNYGIAVDIGTSTVVAHLLDLKTGGMMDAEAMYNSQRAYGEEVTRRILYAERGGLEQLQKTVVNDVNNLITALVARNKIAQHDCWAVLCAGNTTMMHLLLGLGPASIRRDPYVSSSTAPPPVRAAEVGIQINPRGLLYCLPAIGGWVGGDVTAGILATGLYESDTTVMLIDVGTNGEIVIGHKDWMVACSASAGPAFEGSGVKCGMKASRGAIERVQIAADGHLIYKTVGNAKPKGICGSGLIDLVAGLFEAGLVDRSGRLLPEASPRIRTHDGLSEFVVVPAQRTGTGKEIVITQADIENLLRAKAAIYAGALILMKSLALDFDDIDRVFLAGGFGNYLDREKAITIGMIPDLPLEKTRFVGNTSVIGAKLTLLSQEALEKSYEIAKNVTYYDLISFPHYYEEFLAAKFLPHTEIERFPSVQERLNAQGVKALTPSPSPVLTDGRGGLKAG